MNCPKCYTVVPNTHINVATDVAQCTHCQTIFKISDHLSFQMDEKFDKSNPPKGAWIQSNVETLVLGATTRSWYALYLVPFMAVWSGFSLSGLYGTQIFSGHFNLLTSLFGIPFLLGTIYMGSLALMMVFGKVEITLDNVGGKIFTGIGIIGRTQSFEWADISSISEEITTGNRGGQSAAIQIDGKKRLSFGSLLSDERRYYVLKSLQQVFFNKEMKKGFI